MLAHNVIAEAGYGENFGHGLATASGCWCDERRVWPNRRRMR
jgi:hypothetical protein